MILWIDPDILQLHKQKCICIAPEMYYLYDWKNRSLLIIAWTGLEYTNVFVDKLIITTKLRILNNKLEPENNAKTVLWEWLD